MDLSQDFTSFHFTGFEREFDILEENTSTQEMPYDYKSVMHFIGNVYAPGSCLKTIVPLQKLERLGNTVHPTYINILQANILYCDGIYIKPYLVHTTKVMILISQQRNRNHICPFHKGIYVWKIVFLSINNAMYILYFETNTDIHILPLVYIRLLQHKHFK